MNKQIEKNMKYKIEGGCAGWVIDVRFIPGLKTKAVASGTGSGNGYFIVFKGELLGDTWHFKSEADSFTCDREFNCGTYYDSATATTLEIKFR
jgi:hypothetical protein